MIRLMVVDDHELVRLGMRHILADYPSIKIVGEAGDGETAIRLNHEVKPDVVLLDISLPGLSGFEVTTTHQINVQQRPVRTRKSFNNNLFRSFLLSSSHCWKSTDITGHTPNCGVYLGVLTTKHPPGAPIWPVYATN